MGKAGEDVNIPKPAQTSKKKIAVIGAGPAGISAAWHLTFKGYAVTLLDTSDTIGGKISSLIPDSRIPKKPLKLNLTGLKK